MNNTVWKYELERACRNQPLWMPEGAHHVYVATVQSQNGLVWHVFERP